jgi:2-polyprenyl-3-methyl-5-hydroxy-6-metoxy-1,4-benzoquinol methylase
VLFERAWLDRFVARLRPGGRVLDAGCGAGEPIAAYLIDKGFDLTGVDASERMLDLCRSRFPGASWRRMDLRRLDLGSSFDGIISWDASFHLTQDEQRGFLRRCAELLTPGGALMLTIGHEAGEVLGVVEGEAVYHASLAAEAYREALEALGFCRIRMMLQDEDCDEHSVLLASLPNRSGMPVP